MAIQWPLHTSRGHGVATPVPQTLEFTYDLTAAETTGLKGILLFHHHNATQTAEVITLQPTWISYLPFIMK